MKRETRVTLGAAALLGKRRVSARQGWAGEKPGLSEQPAGHLASVSGFRHGIVSGVIISFLNELLGEEEKERICVQAIQP